MNKEELVENLKYFYDNESTIGVTIYALTKGESELLKLDISSSALPDLKSLFLKSIKDNIINPEELDVIPLSSSDDRINVIYEYDIDLPEDIAKLKQVTETDDITIFNVNDDNISSIKALIIEIGDNEHQLVLYKSMPSISFYGLSSFFLKKSSQRFDKITEEFLRITSHFQVMRIQESVFVLDLKTIEKMFGFHDAIVRLANTGIEAIQSFGVIENPETLSELVDDITFARKLTKVARNSPVIPGRERTVSPY